MRVTPRYPAPPFLVFVLAAFAAFGCGHDSTAPAPKTGAIQITVSTVSTIADVDTASYQVSVDNGAWQAVGVPARLRIDGLTKAKHRIELSGVALDCAVTGGNPLWVDLNPDAGTLLVTFSVECAPGGLSPWDY